MCVHSHVGVLATDPVIWIGHRGCVECIWRGWWPCIVGVGEDGRPLMVIVGVIVPKCALISVLSLLLSKAAAAASFQVGIFILFICSCILKRIMYYQYALQVV